MLLSNLYIIYPYMCVWRIEGRRQTINRSEMRKQMKNIDVKHWDVNFKCFVKTKEGERISEIRHLTGIFATFHADAETVMWFGRLPRHRYRPDGEFLQTQGLRCRRGLSDRRRLWRARGVTHRRDGGRTRGRCSPLILSSLREPVTE